MTTSPCLRLHSSYWFGTFLASNVFRLSRFSIRWKIYSFVGIPYFVGFCGEIWSTLTVSTKCGVFIVGKSEWVKGEFVTCDMVPYLFSGVKFNFVKVFRIGLSLGLRSRERICRMISPIWIRCRGSRWFCLPWRLSEFRSAIRRTGLRAYGLVRIGGMRGFVFLSLWLWRFLFLR